MIFTANPYAFAQTGESAQDDELPSDFEYAELPLINNGTDSSLFPGYSIEDIHGAVDASGAKTVSSLFSDEAFELFSREIDRIADFSPAEDAEVSAVLGKVESFMVSGGVGSYLDNGDLLMGSEIGLTENKTDKVKVLGEDSNGSGWIYIVDADALCWQVMDEDGIGIEGALVSISYLDDEGKRVTQSVVTTDGHTPGIAAFDKIPERFFGIVDIQAPGYRSVSILDKQMGRKGQYDIILEETKDDDLYIRGVDLSGKDMINEETDINLMEMDTEDLCLKVLVTKSGSSEFPSSIELYSETREKTVATLSQSSGYEYDSNTRVYSASGRWAEKASGLLEEGDVLSVRFGGEEKKLEHVTVKNALFTPGTKQTQMPLTAKPMPGAISDRLEGSGVLNMTFQVLQVPITIGFFPDGNMILMASYDITNLDKNTQYKFSSLFEKSWNPKNLETADSSFEIFERDFWENTEKVKAGDVVLESDDKIIAIPDKNYNFSMSFSVFLRSCYNKETDDSYGSGGIMFSGSFKGGVTEYFLFTAGAIVIPAYIGFEAGITINTAINVNFNIDQPPIGEENDPKWTYASAGDTDFSARIEVLVGFSVFGGVGVKGVLGAGATGYVNMDIAAVLAKGKASPFTEDPHCFIDVLYGLTLNYYLLIYSGNIVIECATDAKRIYDSNGEEDPELLSEMDFEFRDLSLETCADDLVPVLTDDGSVHDPAFELRDGNPSLDLESSTVDIDVNTYPDNQLQFVTTKNYTALFRIVSNGQKAVLMYQLQNRDTGNLSPTFYMVPLPDGDTRSVSEFVAVPNKTDSNDPRYCDKVYIAAILADNGLSDENERMRSTDVATMVVDLDDRYTVSASIASDPAKKGEYVYSAPMPAGREDYCVVAYAATRLINENGESVNGLKELLGAIPGKTSYFLSTYSDDAHSQRVFYGLGSDKVHSTGAIAPGEPCFWYADTLRSSDKWLVMKGVGSNGYFSETDTRCFMRVDIEGLVDAADIYAGKDVFNPLVTNWQYVNGCNYFVIGGSVYWMNKSSSAGSYSWETEKIEGGSGIISADKRYVMITNNDQSAVYIVGVIEDYEVDVEEGTVSKGANRAQVHTITVDKNWSTGEEKAVVHGPLTLNFAKGEVITSFTAVYNPESSQGSGLTIAYDAPIERREVSAQAGEAVRARLWMQNASKGLLVTKVTIPNYLVRQGQPFIELLLTVRNYGYARENPIPYKITDENGTVLVQTDGTNDYSGEMFYTGDELYPGESRVDRILIRPNPDWTLSSEHEIIAEVTGAYTYNGSLDDMTEVKAFVRADNMSLSARNTLIGGKHYVSTAVTNNTIIGNTPPIIRAEFDYEDGREKTMSFRYPTAELLHQFDPEDEEKAEQVYHYDIDMDIIWEEGLKEGLRGIYFSLVDEEGRQQSNEVIYLQNPEEAQPGKVEGVMTDDDGEALAGVTVGLFEKGSDEPLQTAVSDENGAFSFIGLKAGNYTISIKDVPEGYIPGDEANITADGSGGTIPVTMSCRVIRGNVTLVIRDEKDPEKTLTGARVSVFKDVKKIAELEEVAGGAYEAYSLPYGSYTIRIDKAPEGYVVTGIEDFSITEDGLTVYVYATGRIKDPDSPGTGDMKLVPLYILFMIASMALVLWLNKKIKKVKV